MGFKNIVLKPKIILARDMCDLTEKLEDYVNNQQEEKLRFISFNIISQKTVKNEMNTLTKYEVIISFKKASR